MKYSYPFTVCAVLALSACGSNTVKETLGLSRGTPDEFRVVSRPPLSVPPEFSLRPPGAGSEAPGQQSDVQARSMVLGASNAKAADAKPVVLRGKAAKPAAKSSAEDAFLRNAGAAAADPNVRNELVEEKYVKQQEEEDAPWWDVWSKVPTKKEPIVKAGAEANRIQKNEEEGKPVTEGATPETNGKDTGVLGRIFGY
jgi:hypothetical protein